jgi:hypothetical protein
VAALLAGASCLAQAADRYLIVRGLSGESQYEEIFTGQLKALQAAAEQVAARKADVQVLDGEAATLAGIQAQFERLRTGLRQSDRLHLVLLGHGSYDGSEYKFNIPGPDLTATELKRLLDELPQGEQLVMVLTSASGAVLEPLAAERRVLITATKSGLERNAPVFARFWIEGLGDELADVDKNSMLSARELFDYTSTRVAAHFTEEGYLATEHARLAGEAADRITIARVGRLRNVTLGADVEGLIAQRQEHEDRLRDLRERRGSMSEDEYLDQLEPLMLELGRLQRQIDARTGTPVGGSADE